MPHASPQQPVAKKAKKTQQEIDHQLDEALKDSFPNSDPVAITTPGGPVQPGENPKDKQTGQKPEGEKRPVGNRGR